MTNDNKRKWNPNFVKYTELIAKHPNYNGIYYERQDNGRIKWVVTGKSKSGVLRRKWWDKKCGEYGIKVEPGCYAEIARAIHPTKQHVCQICGQTMSVYYVYPTKRLLKSLNKIAKTINISEFKFRDLDIIAILKIILSTDNSPYDELRDIFNIPASIKNTKKSFKDYIGKVFIANCNRLFSPGVMSNSPDRLDGFHSDGLCCRSETDKGRHYDNLKRYSQDRRAYENWTAGNWNLANRLMSEFKRFKRKVNCPICSKKSSMTADHIGPISLGFTHRDKFRPMCKSCNSKKNNRMTAEDVSILIDDENSGDKVISWHSQYIWNKLKNSVNNNDDSLKLSKIMRAHLHNVLTLFSTIKNTGFKEFLIKYLHPEHSFFDYKFKNFDPLNLEKLVIQKKKWDSKNRQKNANRYIRISLDALDDYQTKKNRRVQQWISTEVDRNLKALFFLLKKKEYNKANKQLILIIKNLSDLTISRF